MPDAPLTRGIRHFGIFVLSARLLLSQLLIHLINVSLQLINTLPLALLHEATDKEKQEKNHKSDYHLVHSFLSN